MLNYSPDLNDKMYPTTESELLAIDCLLELQHLVDHKIFDKENRFLPPIRLNPYIPHTFVFNGMNFNNAKDLPDGIADTNDFVFNFHGKQLHHDDPDFPAQLPDLFCNDPSDRKSGFTHLDDVSKRRLRFCNKGTPIVRSS